MPLDIGLWRVDGSIQRIASSGMPTEARLEDLIETDPAVLGQPLLLIGRQVTTSHGKRIDLLALDGDGALHLLELKRDRTPRDVIAQALDYGSWAASLTHEDVLDLYKAYRPDLPLEVAFEDTFGIPLPDELNSGHWLTIIAADIDPESQRIVEYLADSYAVPINVVFFRYFKDGDREYVARTWLLDQVQEPGPRSGPTAKQKEPWNGTDWYVSFGEENGSRSWEDARRYGFVSAGGGDWYSRSLRSLPEGAQVWVCIPKVGYVGTGTVTGPAQPFQESPFASEALTGTYTHANGEDEWVVPVRWDATRDADHAYWEKGMFANQNSACKLRRASTLDRLKQEFGVGQ